MFYIVPLAQLFPARLCLSSVSQGQAAASAFQFYILSSVTTHMQVLLPSLAKCLPFYDGTPMGQTNVYEE